MNRSQSWKHLAFNSCQHTHYFYRASDCQACVYTREMRILHITLCVRSLCVCVRFSFPHMRRRVTQILFAVIYSKNAGGWTNIHRVPPSISSQPKHQHTLSGSSQLARFPYIRRNITITALGIQKRPSHTLRHQIHHTHACNSACTLPSVHSSHTHKILRANGIPPPPSHPHRINTHSHGGNISVAYSSAGSRLLKQPAHFVCFANMFMCDANECVCLCARCVNSTIVAKTTCPTGFERASCP